MIKNIAYLMTVMIYYFIESLIVAFFINVAYIYILASIFKVEIGYFQWVILIWIVKVLFFD